MYFTLYLRARVFFGKGSRSNYSIVIKEKKVKVIMKTKKWDIFFSGTVRIV